MTTKTDREMKTDNRTKKALAEELNGVWGVGRHAEGTAENLNALMRMSKSELLSIEGELARREKNRKDNEKLNRYLSTDEGKAEREQMKKRIADSRESLSSLRQQLTERVNGSLRDSRYNLKVASLSPYSLRLMHGSRQFGLDFDVYSDEDGISLNYGSLGSFNPATEKGRERTDFLANLAMFASDRIIQSLVKDCFTELQERTEAVYKLEQDEADGLFKKAMESAA